MSIQVAQAEAKKHLDRRRRRDASTHDGSGIVKGTAGLIVASGVRDHGGVVDFAERFVVVVVLVWSVDDVVVVRLIW